MLLQVTPLRLCMSQVAVHDLSCKQGGIGKELVASLVRMRQRGCCTPELWKASKVIHVQAERSALRGGDCHERQCRRKSARLNPTLPCHVAKRNDDVQD